MNAQSSGKLSNRQPKAICTSYPIRAKKVSLNKGPDCEFAATGITTKRTSGLGRIPGRSKGCQQKNVYTTSSTAEILDAAHQNIEAEHKYVERRKRCKNASVRCENVSVLEKKDNKDERSKIIS